MAKLKKEVFPKDLHRFRVLIEDTAPSSDYFKLSEIPDVLTAGKNAFLINGSVYLVPTTKVLVEILDADNDPIFTQPIKNYQEGLARVESIEVYEDTPPGAATLVILGEAEYFSDGTPVPPEWRGKYNVRWKKEINVQPFAINKTKIRLYETPTLDVSEVLIQYRDPVTSSIEYIFGSGTLAMSGDPYLTSSNLSYTLINIDPPISRSYEGATVYSSLYDYTASIVQVINSSSALVSNGVYPSGSGFDHSAITIEYQPPPTFQGTALTRSYADIQLSKLTTFSGDVARAKIYVKSVDQPSDYQQIEDITLEETPLLVTASFSGEGILSGERDVYIGYIDNQAIIDAYWKGGFITGGYVDDVSVGLIYDSSRLIDSMYLSSVDYLVSTGSLRPQVFVGLSTPIDFEGNAEYTMHAKFACVKATGFTAQMEVYLSGSAFPSTDPLGVKIQSYQLGSSDTYKRFEDEVFNFVAPRTGEATLNFVAYGGKWFYSDIEVNSSQETGFNPDQARVLAAIIGRRYERLQFKAELYDPNNNIVPVLIESEPKFFDGGNYVFKGYDHRVEGEIQVIPSGANPDLTGIKLTTKGFYSGGSGGPAGAYTQGSSIHIGSGSVFTRETPFIVASDLTGRPEIAIGDKLYGYVDDDGNFVLKILGTILIGSGSNFIDIRKLLPRSPKDTNFARVTAYAGDFYDLRGRYAVSSGEWDDQIARSGHYTRANEPPVLQTPLTSSIATAQYNAFATQSFELVSSCSLIIPDSQIGINNNTLYLSANIAVTEHSSSEYFNFQYSATSYASWTGYPDPDLTVGVEFAGDDSIGVVEPGSVINTQTVRFPIVLPTPRVGNTLYLLVHMDVTTTPAV